MMVVEHAVNFLHRIGNANGGDGLGVPQLLQGTVGESAALAQPVGLAVKC